MRKHVTNSELNKVRKLLARGINDPAEIQTQVFIHEESIQNIIDVYNRQNKSAVQLAADEAVKLAEKEQAEADEAAEAAKKATAAAAAAAKPKRQTAAQKAKAKAAAAAAAAAAKDVDPLS